MKRIIIYICVALLVAVTACEKKDKSFINPIPVDYKSWHRPLKKSLDYPIPGHGKSRRIIYINEKALQARLLPDTGSNNKVDFPDESIVIKEVFKPEGSGYQVAPQLVVMVKDRTDENSQDGWLYYVRNPGSPKVKLIKNRFCVGCHEAANEVHPYFDNNLEGIFRDYVFLPVAK